jgi:hypothetical protein
MLLVPLCFDDYPHDLALLGMQRKHTHTALITESMKRSWRPQLVFRASEYEPGSRDKAQPQWRHRRMPGLAFNEAIQYGDCSRHERKHNSHSESGSCYKKFCLKWKLLSQNASRSAETLPRFVKEQYVP